MTWAFFSVEGLLPLVQSQHASTHGTSNTNMNKDLNQHACPSPPPREETEERGGGRERGGGGDRRERRERREEGEEHHDNVNVMQL